MRRPKDQPDPHELAAERMRARMGPYEPLPALLKRGDLRKVLLVVVAGLVVLGIVKAGGGGKTPAAPGSCTKAAFALDRDQVRTGRLVSWSASGPSADAVVLTADSPTADKGLLIGPEPLEHCAAKGRFLVELPEGRHVVRAFLVRADGTTTPVASRTLEVDAR